MKVNFDMEELFKKFMLYNSINDDNCLDENYTIIAITIDVYGILNIIEFFNRCIRKEIDEINWRSHLLFIRFMSVILYEILNCNYFSKVKGIIDESFVEKLAELRAKIHQFRFREFEKRNSAINVYMGRSRDKTKPNLDTVLEYIKTSDCYSLFGTNIWEYNIKTDELQDTVLIMQQLFREIQKVITVDNSFLEVQETEIKYKVKRYSYCYTDIIRKCYIKSNRLVDRLIFAVDELASLENFFRYTMKVDIYLKEKPFMLYFLAKLISIVFDETIDNIKNYIDKSDIKDNTTEKLRNVLDSIDENIIIKTKIIRNNLHYDRQDRVNFKDEHEIYEFMQKLLTIVYDLRIKLIEILSIKPSKTRLYIYKFLGWVQS